MDYTLQGFTDGKLVYKSRAYNRLEKVKELKEKMEETDDTMIYHIFDRDGNKIL